MKCIVIYFSQSGNTEKIALSIQKGIKQAAGHCDIVKIKDANPRRLYEYDLIGLGSFVMGVPEIVRTFIKDLWSVGGKHFFVFSTHGSTPEFYFPMIVPRLKRRGLTVIGMKSWYCDCTLLHHCDPYPSKGHPDEIDVREAEEFGREMVERSRRISAGETGLIPQTPKKPQLPTFLPDAGKDRKETPTVKKFASMLKYHKEKCLYPKCRLCMDNCPVYGIDLTRKPPIIAKPCDNCEWCVRICPSGALDALDWLEAMSESMCQMTEKIVLPKFAKAEAEGHFRRLLPVEEITGTLRYKIRTKHPQWTIGKGERKM